ncbi:hypothetical protein [Lactococcus garvieae]|uniref:hypothetical protein n=1 Tax=Lactococcus garvieae TaxID=1363 RepID=UPI0021F8CF32|nr:hypothetical protein [Lactococcus garvieae]UYT11577.1 hypothetical protein OF800_06045 [Lactococcus garvieae]
MKKNTPKIRFMGFTDDWEQRKLGDIKDVRDGTHDSPKYKDIFVFWRIMSTISNIFYITQLTLFPIIKKQIKIVKQSTIIH